MIENEFIKIWSELSDYSGNNRTGGLDKVFTIHLAVCDKEYHFAYAFERDSALCVEAQLRLIQASVDSLIHQASKDFPTFSVGAPIDEILEELKGLSQ